MTKKPFEKNVYYIETFLLHNELSCAKYLSFNFARAVCAQKNLPSGAVTVKAKHTQSWFDLGYPR